MKRQTLLVPHCQTSGMNNILLFHLLFSFILTISVSFSFLAENDFFPDSKKNIYLTKLTFFLCKNDRIFPHSLFMYQDEIEHEGKSCCSL